MASYSYDEGTYDTEYSDEYDDGYAFLAASHGRFDSDEEEDAPAVKMQSSFLTSPKLEKESMEGHNSQLRYATCTMQGWRAHQEDQMITMPDFPAKHEGFSFHNDQLSFFAVCDGHGGGQVSDLLRKELPRRLKEEPRLRKDPSGTLEQMIIQLDKDILAGNYDVGEKAGSTCVMVVIDKKNVTVSNTGDSRCVLCKNGKAFAMTVDHEPNSKEEQRRIESAGGFVLNNRVNGKLALSRSVGNVALKKSTKRPYHQQLVVATPDVRTTRLKGVSFLVIACDGIWEVMSNSEVIRFVKDKLSRGKSLPSIARALVHACVAPEGSHSKVGRDNMSVIIVAFNDHEDHHAGPTSSSETQDHHIGTKASVFEYS